MNDDKVTPAHVAIVSPSGEVLNKQPKYGPNGKRTRPPADFMQGIPTRDEISEHMAAGLLAVGEKIYEQLSGETATYLREMEAAIYDRLKRDLAARTLRGRLRAMLWRFNPPKLVVSTTAAVEAMDPNVNGLEQALDEVANEEEANVDISPNDKST